MSTQSQQQPFVQAQPNAGQDVLAVACVIDASLSAEWHRVVPHYIFPFIKRLNEAYTGHQFLLALVTYGEADMRPSPLLLKRFFYPVLLSNIMKDLCEDLENLGIGSATGVRGLSALEGIVAAIEFFDILHNPLVITGKDNGALISHILHVVASPPDSTQLLHHVGTVSWNTLPLELQKRNISLSLVALQQIPRFQDVQAAAEKALPSLGPRAPGGAGAVGRRPPSIQPTPSQALQTLVPHAAPFVPSYSYSEILIPDLTAFITRCI